MRRAILHEELFRMMLYDADADHEALETDALEKSSCNLTVYLETEDPEREVCGKWS